MTRYAILVLTAAWLLSPSAPAVGQSPPASAARKALESDVAVKGLTLLEPIKVDSLAEDEYTNFTVDVKADVDLVIRVACSSFCISDLKVFDAAGATLGDDTSGTATPQVVLAAGHHPTRIEVLADLQACDKDTCSIAVGVYKR